jgi:hypothetical protein
LLLTLPLYEFSCYWWWQLKIAFDMPLYEFHVIDDGSLRLLLT